MSNYKTGDKILVSEKNEGPWLERIYLYTRPDGHVVCVDHTDDAQKWKTLRCLCTCSWTFHKEYPSLPDFKEGEVIYVDSPIGKEPGVWKERIFLSWTEKNGKTLARCVEGDIREDNAQKWLADEECEICTWPLWKKFEGKILQHTPQFQVGEVILVATSPTGMWVPRVFLKYDKSLAGEPEVETIVNDPSDKNVQRWLNNKMANNETTTWSCFKKYKGEVLTPKPKYTLLSTEERLNELEARLEKLEKFSY